MVYGHPVIAATTALRFPDHVTERNGGSGDENDKRCEELYKEKYGNFPNLVKNCPFAPQASICSHVPKSSSQKGWMNLSLNSVFSKYTANSDFPMPLELCPISTTSAIHLFKNSTWLCSRTGKKQVPSCSCLRYGLE